MKRIVTLQILFITCSIFFTGRALSQIGNAEIRIDNKWTQEINISLIPASTIFSGHWSTEGINHKYTFRRSRTSINTSSGWEYVVGNYSNFTNVAVNEFRLVDFDDGNFASANTGKVIGGIGPGLWRLQFTNAPNDDSDPLIIAECYLDYRDANYGTNYVSNNFTNDLYFELKRENNQDKLNFKFGGGNWININDPRIENRTIKLWEQVGRWMVGYGEDPHFPGSPNKGNFQTTDINNGQYLYLPLIATNYGATNHLNSNMFWANFSISTGHHAFIRENQTIYIESGATFSILPSSFLTFQNNSTLVVKSGGKLCNYGIINGNVRIIYERNGRMSYCAGWSDGIVKGGNVTIEDSTIVEFPDSTTWVFDSTSVLTMMPHSELRMGKSSKIIFQNGARINCNYAKFTSLDSADTWDGIYLIDNANDTLKNCTFENAYNGININTDFAAPLVDTHTTIIQNCKFRNSTTGILLNQVYINDADGILIDNCTTESNIATGYSTGYVLQYCASNGVVITNNILNNCGYGITAIQSSPYIARNVITGQTASGTGIYLDNSNGTIEYNRVYNFEKSIEGSYSSPYLLKNTLSDASLQSIALTNNSVPVLRPVVSGSAVRWLGGNNRITGSPVYGAFNFSKDCYPMIDSGYNVIHVTNADYVMADLDDDYYATFNNWYDNPPITSLFNVQGGSLYYDPVFDGTTLPTTDYFELNSLGFDMYDSVFVKNIGDNPGAGTLFMQAYTNESQGNYTSAINLYKEVIAQYRNTEYAPVSLARIFNSLEKNNSSSTAYGQIQAYYTGIKTDTTQTLESREIAEDFVIKAKVKQGNVSEAISDYENIYQMNQNSPKGTHALVNKMCLENMLQGLTDDPNEPVKLNPNKAGLLAFLTRNITSNSQSTINNSFPTSFRLYQNYPNPFNPQTTIRFDVPKNAMVSVRIYDLLGREVFNYSGYQTTGTHEMKFDGSNFASGMYFYSVETNGFKETKKMVLLK